MRASLPRFARAFALLSTIALGCIPSHRLVHEGDVYFERCYGADFDHRIAQSQRESCWQAWIAHYTKHQPAHRVDYALRRVEALQNGEPPPELPGMVTGALGEKQVEAELQAVEQVANNNTSSLLAATADGDGGVVPNGCLHFCNEYEGACNARCQGASHACFVGCERERAICLRGCH